MTAVEPMDRRQPHIRLRPNIRVRRHIPVRRHIRVRPVRINGEPGRGVNEDGFGLVELIIAIVILTTVMVSGAQLVAGMAFAAADQRARVIASNLATQEIEKVRQGASATSNNFFGTTAPAGNISYVSYDPGAHPASSQVLNGVTFTIVDQEQLGDSGSSGSACTNGNASQAQILHVDTKVTWTVKSQTHTVDQFTNIAPPASVNNPTFGNIGVKVLGALGQAITGLAVTSYNPSSSVTTNATTASDGCAFFAGLTPTDGAGKTITYTVSIGPFSNYVSNQERPTYSTALTVTSGKTTEINQTFDQAATLTISGYSYPDSGSYPPVSPMEISVANAAIAPGGDFVTLPAGSPPATPTSLSSLFPFQNGYGVFAGGCADNNPNGVDNKSNPIYPKAPTLPPAAVTANTTTSTTVGLVPLTVQVLNNDGTPATGAVVSVAYHPTSGWNCTSAPPTASFPTAIGPSPATETAGIGYGRWDLTADLNGKTAVAGIWVQPAQPNASPATAAGIYPQAGGTTPLASPLVMRLAK